jgi:hypothetical protein
MQDTFEDPELPGSKPRKSPITIAMTIAVIASVLAGFWFLFGPLHGRRGPAVRQAVIVNMSPAEREYAKKIEIGKITMSRAENFLHQEVTTLNGEVYNGGSEPVIGLGLTTEFSDDMNQIVLRETRGVLRAPNAVLAPGEQRGFEISFDHVPNAWNMQVPTVRVSYLKLSPRKQ